MATEPRDITIVGGGIIGCCSAYYLTRHPAYDPAKHRITLLEASASSAGGRTADSLQDAATLLGPDARDTFPRNPAHDGIAGGASGKAGGLLALWAFPSNIVPLSFRLHAELAQEHGGEAAWGYRRCYASQVNCKARVPPGFSSDDDQKSRVEGAAGEEGASKGLHKDHKKAAQALQKLGAPADLDWIDTEHSLNGYENMGTPDNTAQVHPELFTRAMAQLAEAKGVRIVTGARVTAINKTEDGKSVESVTYEKQGEAATTTLPTTDCVVAAGPWTSRLLPQIRVTASRAHSVVIKTPQTVSPYALFTAIKLPAGFPSATNRPLRGAQMAEPEIYARPDGTAYACGPTDSEVPLPASNAEVAVDAARCDDIARQVGGISDALGRDGAVLARQACYLPQGGPYIGAVAAVRGLSVAAGHTCWGIQNAPATGKLVSEIVLDGEARSAQLGGCDPRFA